MQISVLTIQTTSNIHETVYMFTAECCFCFLGLPLIVWEDVKDGMDEALRELENAYNDIVSRPCNNRKPEGHNDDG